MASENRRKSPWVGKAIWERAQERAKEDKVAFASTMRTLIDSYGDGGFDIDPREIPATDATRGGRAVFPTPEGWKKATERADREHGVSASVMTECIVTRYAKGQVRITPPAAATVTEVQPVRKDMLKDCKAPAPSTQASTSGTDAA
jgi:hypothetical protein